MGQSIGCQSQTLWTSQSPRLSVPHVLGQVFGIQGKCFLSVSLSSQKITWGNLWNISHLPYRGMLDLVFHILAVGYSVRIIKNNLDVCMWKSSLLKLNDPKETSYFPITSPFFI